MSVCSQGGSQHVTITHDALGLTLQGPPTPTCPHPKAWDLTVQGPPTPAPPTNEIWWQRPVQALVQTCSLEDPAPTSADIW